MGKRGIYEDLTGMQFNWLTVIGKAKGTIRPNGGKVVKWECICKCGKIIKTTTGHLNSNHTKSCGCIIKETKTIHDLSRSRFYRIWSSMKARCDNKEGNRSTSYFDKGIKVCSGWVKFKGFHKDMYENYLNHCKIFGESNTSIDRKNNDGNYEINNCKWSTNKEQANNKSNSANILYNGEIKTVSEWAELYNINVGTLHTRINSLKWNIDKCLNYPIKHTERNKKHFILGMELTLKEILTKYNVSSQLFNYRIKNGLTGESLIKPPKERIK